MIVDRDHPGVCPALAVLRMAWRKARFKHPMSKPLAVFKDKTGKVSYVTQSKVTEDIRTAVKNAYQDMPKRELMNLLLLLVWPTIRPGSPYMERS